MNANMKMFSDAPYRNGSDCHLACRLTSVVLGRNGAHQRTTIVDRRVGVLLAATFGAVCLVRRRSHTWLGRLSSTFVVEAVKCARIEYTDLPPTDIARG